MSCSPYDLRDYFFGELARDQQRAVDQHVHACAACREELEELRLTQATLLTLRDEEPPRRIAFVSDKIFEPTLWQRLWQSGPRLGFASAAVLSAAIVAHGFLVARPASGPAPPVAQVQPAKEVSRGELAQVVDRAVAQAVAESEARQEAKFRQVLAKERDGFELQNRAMLAQVADEVEAMRKLSIVQLHAANDIQPPRITQ